MSLIECPECKRKVSSEANNCIFCGYPLNKLKKEIKIKEQEEINVPRVIAIRGEPGSIKGVIIFDFIGGIFLTILGVLGILFSINPELYFLTVLAGILAALGIFAIIVGIQGFIRMHMNDNNIHPCIEYIKEENKIYLYKINGVKITISPDKYVSLKDNLFTDNLLYFTYIDYLGKRRKVNLGYCANREEIRTHLDKLRNKYRY